MSKLTSLPTLYGLDTFSTSTIRDFPYGAVAYDSIGRKFRYVKNGGVALVKGHLLQSPARDTAFTDMAVQAAAAIGAKAIYVTLGATATTAGIFDDGVLVTTVTPGEGQNFTIVGHSVAAGAATCIFNIDETVLTALTTSTKVTAGFNPYNGVVDSPTTRTGLSVGVAITAIPISNYGFIGVEGLFGVLSDATIAAVGEGVSPSTGTAGAVTKQVTLLENIGTAPILGVSAKYEPVHFRIG